jgi:cytochrome c553
MNKLAIALISLPLVAFSGAALAGDAAAGKAKADACLDCHEPAEDFAGQAAAQIEARIREVKGGAPVNGKKHAAEINDLAEEDIADVAAWFAKEGAQ